MLENWITKALAASDRKQATEDLYATLARTHLVPTVGTVPLGRLRPSDVEALVVAKQDAGLASSTVRTMCTVLRGASDVAVRDGLLRSNPAAAVKRPGVERKDPAHLAADQAQALLEAIRGDRLETLSRLMLATGLRRGKALALHWCDVDPETRVLRVRGTLARVQGRLLVIEPKTAESERVVPMSAPAERLLRDIRAAREAERGRVGSLRQETGFASTTETGEPCDPAEPCAHSRSVLRGPVCRTPGCTLSGMPRPA